jgi:hypothetical protein
MSKRKSYTAADGPSATRVHTDAATTASLSTASLSTASSTVRLAESIHELDPQLAASFIDPRIGLSGSRVRLAAQAMGINGAHSIDDLLMAIRQRLVEKYMQRHTPDQLHCESRVDQLRHAQTADLDPWTSVVQRSRVYADCLQQSQRVDYATMQQVLHHALIRELKPMINDVHATVLADQLVRSTHPRLREQGIALQRIFNEIYGIVYQEAVSSAVAL